MELRVVEERAVEELELPVRAAADVENAIGRAAAVEDDDAAVVEERGFGGAVGCGGVARGDVDLVELHAGAGGAPLELCAGGVGVAGEADELRGRGGGVVCGRIGRGGKRADVDGDFVAAEAGAGEVDAHGDGRVVERGLARVGAFDAEIAETLGLANDERIDRGQAGGGGVGEAVREIGGVAVGEENDASERLAGEAFAHLG